ncbi:MAG: hypothetical protein LBF08_01095, partial [Dysgonamonadaceae bacterium]|nr:hypothetical protein [Dysgonamonadaceae bacterium]
MKKFILLLSILFIGFIAKSDNYLYGHGRHVFINDWYPNGTTITVTPDNGIVNIQLENIYINWHQIVNDFGSSGRVLNSRGRPCIDIMEGNQVRIILKGDNFLQGGPGCPAIRVRPGAELFIDGYSEGNGSLGRLVARGGIDHVFEQEMSGDTENPQYLRAHLPAGAGIGGGWDYASNIAFLGETYPTEWEKGLWCNDWWWLDQGVFPSLVGNDWSDGYGGCGKIHINGAIVEAYGGGKWAPGIGPSRAYSLCEEIMIQLGSQVYAKGGEEAPGIGCSDKSCVKEIIIAHDNTRVVAEGGDGAPGIGCGRGINMPDYTNARINAINLLGGHVVAKAGNPKSNRTDVAAIGAMDCGEILNINFGNGVVDASNGGIRIYPEWINEWGKTIAVGGNINYTGGNVVFHKTNQAINLPGGKVSDKYATIVFKDPDITTSEGLTIKIGNNDYVHPGVTGGEDRRLTDDKKMQLHLTSNQTGKIIVYENEELRYGETARVNNGDHALITLERIFSAGFDVIGENPAINRKVRYNGTVYPNHTILVDDTVDVTFIVHGADINDVPVYRYVWYKDGVKVDEGYKKNTYT